MTFSAGSRTSVAPFMEDERQHRRQIAAWAIQANQGHIANTGSLTLTINATSTSAVDARAGVSSYLDFMPMTANAASELGNGTLWVKNQGKQVFTVKHANNAQADRTFRYCILG